VPTFFAAELARRHARKAPVSKYNASYPTQFKLLMYRFLLAYWRSPTYNFVRMVVSVVIALIFSSTYADQKYTSDVDVISRVALIYITVLFMGVVGMISVQPVVFAERPAFYREQFCEIYDVKLYALAATLVEVICHSHSVNCSGLSYVSNLRMFSFALQLPYLILSSVMFVIPFFFIVGFDKDGTTDKFFWYWLFQAVYMSVMVFVGHLLANALPSPATSNGNNTTTFGFCINAYVIWSARSARGSQSVSVHVVRDD
jgi:hypothetical protein